MSISNNWLVPLTANEKNFRAVYRAAHQGAYIEDLSYYQCVATESSKPVKLISWIDNENEETIGQVFQIQMSEGKSLIWTHPGTSKQVLEAIQRSNSEATKCDKYCLFLLIGPLWVEKIGQFEEHVKVLNIADLPIFKNDENVSDEQVVVARLPGSIGFLLVVEKPSSYKLWLKFVHSKVVVGCQDSQEHLDVELERLTSSRLQQDIFTESRSHEQEELLKLANHWNKTETLSKFKINRNGLILRQYVKAFEKGKAVGKVSQMPSFIPIVVRLCATLKRQAHKLIILLQIDMVNGGTLEPKSYLYFPSSPSSKADDKFTTDVLHAPFFKSPVIGIVTCTCYSLRRGVSSALGLLSQEAIDAYLNAGCDLQFKVAVEKEANGKFYVGKFRILTNDAGN